MYDINLKNVKGNKKVYYIFLVVGILFAVILGAVFISGMNTKSSMDAQTEASRIEVKEHYDDGSTLYSPVYHYEVNGVEYTCGSTSSSSIYPNTEHGIVYYDSKNPAKCMTDYSSGSNFIVLAFLIIPAIFIIVAVLNILKVNKRVQIIKELNETGKLVKGLPYYMEPTGVVVNGVPIRRPVVNYTLPSGSTVVLQGDARSDKKFADADGLVDILIDINDPTKYYIDFEINRLTGNLDSDYFMGNRNPQQPQQNPYGQQMPQQQNPYANTYGQVAPQQGYPQQAPYGQQVPQQNPYGQAPQQPNPYNNYGQDSYYVNYNNK